MNLTETRTILQFTKMKTNVYNIIWADDEIDNLLDQDTAYEMKERGLTVIGRAHDGKEFESLLKKHLNKVDAVILDANFNESYKDIRSERDVSGLEHSWGILTYRYNREIPFFLFTNRSDEFVRESFRDRTRFAEDFPRHKRWFSKSGEDEFVKMLDEIKRTVDEICSPQFIVRNKYGDVLAAAGKLGEETYRFIFVFLVHDVTGTLDELQEPFVSARKVIETIFKKCEKRCLIPKISDNTTATAYYFLTGKYHARDERGARQTLYEECDGGIMPKPVAQLLVTAVHIVQDAAHAKDGLKLRVNEYYNRKHDNYLLRVVMYSLIDVINWYAETISDYDRTYSSGRRFWTKIADRERADRQTNYSFDE